MVTIKLTTTQVVTLILILIIVFLLIIQCSFSCKKGFRHEGMIRSTLPAVGDGMIQCGDDPANPRNCQFTYGPNSNIFPRIYYRVTGDGGTDPCGA